MKLDDLREHTCIHLRVIAPDITDCAFLVDSCFSDARQYFKDEFISMISPEAWAKITLIYHKHFLDSGKDISIAEIIIAVIRDSITTNRMDMVTLSLAQKKCDMSDAQKKPPRLKIVKD